jgi:periplasmic protein TonB
MSDERWFGFYFADSSSVDGSRPLRAALSIAIHISAVFLIWTALIFLNSSSLRPHGDAIHIPVIVDKLIWRKPPVNTSSGGGDHSLLAPSRGAAPRPSTHKTLLLPILVTNPDAKLQVMPVIDSDAPKLSTDQWGDPLASLVVLSAGPGSKGIGKGTGGDGSAPGNGNGPNGGSGHVFSLSQITTHPILVLKIEPEYSERAREAKFQGTVGLRIVIDEHGIPRQIAVVRLLGLGLDEKAIEAVTRWRFKPALKNGKPVAVEAFVDVNFRLL